MRGEIAGFLLSCVNTVIRHTLHPKDMQGLLASGLLVLPADSPDI